MFKKLGERVGPSPANCSIISLLPPASPTFILLWGGNKYWVPICCFLLNALSACKMQAAAPETFLQLLRLFSQEKSAPVIHTVVCVCDVWSGETGGFCEL